MVQNPVYLRYIMKKQTKIVRTNMLKEELVNKVEQLCADLKMEGDLRHPNLAKYKSYTFSVGKKYIKIISADTFNVSAGGCECQSVWGFVNINEFVKERKMANGIKKVTFKEGDVLLAAGWNTPALNTPRGNILGNYAIDGSNQYGPSYTFRESN
jgi:hypothetical protein